MRNKFRINYNLYGKFRQIKHEEKTQIYNTGGVDSIGVRIDWQHLSKVLEAKNRMLHGEESILGNDEPIKQSTNLVDSLIYFKNKLMGI